MLMIGRGHSGRYKNVGEYGVHFAYRWMIRMRKVWPLRWKNLWAERERGR